MTFVHARACMEPSECASDTGVRMDGGAKLLGREPAGRRSDAVAEELAQMIQSGELHEGDRLPAERDLMQRYGVSRVAVREAIAALANRGFVLTRLGHRP